MYFIIKFLYWLQLFISPVLLMGLIGIFVGQEKIFIYCLIAGALIGLIIAEYVRRKIGLMRFFAGLYGKDKEEVENKSNTNH